MWCGGGGGRSIVLFAMSALVEVSIAFRPVPHRHNSNFRMPLSLFGLEMGMDRGLTNLNAVTPFTGCISPERRGTTREVGGGSQGQCVTSGYRRLHVVYSVSLVCIAAENTKIFRSARTSSTDSSSRRRSSRSAAPGALLYHATLWRGSPVLTTRTIRSFIACHPSVTPGRSVCRLTLSLATGDWTPCPSPVDAVQGLPM